MQKRKTDTNEVLRLHEEGKSLGQIAARFKCSKANICRMVKRLRPDPPKPMPESFERLTEKQQNFVLAKASGKSATQAAAESFDCIDRGTAKQIGFQLMHMQDIDKAIQDILQEEGLTKRYRVRKLKSHVDHKNPDISLKALDQSWKLDGSYAAEKHVVATVNYSDLCKSLDEVREAKAALEKELGMTEMSEEEKDTFIFNKEVGAVPGR